MKKEIKETNSNFMHVFYGILILLSSILFLVAVSGNTTQLIFDYKILHETGLSFFKFIKLEFPPVSNPIGPFGVFFGFWMIQIFGKFLSISILSGTALLGFFSMFLNKEKHFGQKVIFFLVFAFFLNLDLFIIKPKTMNYAGAVPWY
ncbi:MAG: hypothetical protein Q7J16_06425, partial [Candidatus Cloacimonadales bacterium]|nr:hypothetical protein [Candidatus Cloacimonadales bacterium]